MNKYDSVSQADRCEKSVRNYFSRNSSKRKITLISIQLRNNVRCVDRMNSSDIVENVGIIQLSF